MEVKSNFVFQVVRFFPLRTFFLATVTVTAERNGKNIYTKRAFLLQSEDNPPVVNASGNHWINFWTTPSQYVCVLTDLLYLFPKERACFSF